MSSSFLTPEAIRQRRFRRRQHEGVFLVQVELLPKEIEALIVQGYLADDDATDPRRVGAAVRRAAKDTLSRYGQDPGGSHRLEGAARKRPTDHGE